MYSYSKNNLWQSTEENKNPYVEVEPMKEPIEFVSMNDGFKTSNFITPTDDNANPYITPEQYQHITGVHMDFNGINSSNSSTDNDIRTACEGVVTIIRKKFAVSLAGIDLMDHKKRNSASTKLCNFHYRIIDIYLTKHRDGTSHEEVVCEVYSFDLEHRSETPLLRIPEADYPNIAEIITRQFLECYFDPENKNIAKDYLKEFASIIYRDFRQTHQVKKFFAYHGWEQINNAWCYLSDTRNDCKCGISVPQVSSEDMFRIWQNAQFILDVQKKIRNPDGTINEVASLNVILPFFLYNHLGYACKLFKEAGLPVQFLLLIVGKTGSLKTTLCATFAEPFTENSRLNFESTSVAIENYREMCTDMITILDDIFKKSTANLKKMEELTRAFGDGIGRAKSTGKDYKEVLRSKVQGGCIVTAEHELDSQQSSVLRYLSISIDVNSIDTGILKKFQDDAVIAKLENRPNMVQEIFGGWIKYLETNFNQIVLWLMTFQPPPLNLKFKRHQQMYRVFCAIAQMILNWGMFSGNIDANHSQNIFNTWHKVIVDLMLKNQAAATVAEPYQQFLITLQRAIATKILPIAKNKAEFENNGVYYIGYSQTTKGTSDYLLIAIP